MGQVDVLIGTHAILNDKKVKFKDLGLLIVDEEQRFGVKQKEKIKRISKNIDVLSLSATPIPRTLHMSLVGARDMSIIETPPQERFPVQTYVIENNDVIIRDAIKREVRRGGQVYFIYNRIESIGKMYLHLSSMLPDIRIGIAHGQMTEEELERAMLNFYEGKYDMLIATSIIENGLDVPNANTIIILTRIISVCRSCTKCAGASAVPNRWHLPISSTRKIKFCPKRQKKDCRR